MKKSQLSLLIISIVFASPLAIAAMQTEGLLLDIRQSPEPLK